MKIADTFDKKQNAISFKDFKGAAIKTAVSLMLKYKDARDITPEQEMQLKKGVDTMKEALIAISAPDEYRTKVHRENIKKAFLLKPVNSKEFYSSQYNRVLATAKKLGFNSSATVNLLKGNPQKMRLQHSF